MGTSRRAAAYGVVSAAYAAPTVNACPDTTRMARMLIAILHLSLVNAKHDPTSFGGLGDFARNLNVAQHIILERSEIILHICEVMIYLSTDRPVVA